ncbi:MAG: potassium transporter [Epsilonproteobacteria bacterium]|nr:potassium transporter [Campylobacterota bacterium]
MDFVLMGFILTLFISIILNIILAKINVPTIIGYILTGIIIAKLFSMHTEHIETLSHISELGIVFMMFMIGLEFSFRYLLKMKKEVFLYGFLEVFIIGSLFSIIIYLLGFPVHTALILGYTLSLSSTAIVVKMLNVSGDINKQYGRKALGILIFQDIAVIPIMLMIEIFSKDDSNLVLQLAKIGISAVVLIVVMYILGRILFEKILTWVSKLRNEELFIGSILFIVFFSSYFAHMVGFSYSLGAFLAGVLIAETHFKYQIEADIAPFRDLLLGLFFITVGMHLDPIFIIKNIDKVLLILISILVIKALGIYLIIRLAGAQHRTSLKVALALMQVGEFALAVFQISQSKGLLDENIAQLLTAAVVLSMIITPFVLQNLKYIADRLTNEVESDIIVDKEYKNHVIVIGYGGLGKKVVKQLKQKGVEYVIIEQDYNLVNEGLKENEPIYLANAAKREILEKLNIKDACSVVVAISHFKKKRLICDILNDFNFHINIVTVASDSKEKEILEFELDIENIIVDNEEISKIIVQKAMRCEL